ncbi:MAG: mannonate dehydratase [Candidatus Solibacter sp.]|nr:mannonate dehydratase [Candidatus Solibacter sp.]
MNNRLTRRNLMQVAGVTAFAPPLAAAAATSEGPIFEGPNTPKICLGGGGGVPAGLPWQEGSIRAAIELAKANGLVLYNMMLENSFPNTIYGRPGRDEEIEKIRQTIRAAGKAGLPVIEYNFYAHRAMEGYFEETGRAGLGHTGFDYEKMKGLPRRPQPRRDVA